MRVELNREADEEEKYEGLVSMLVKKGKYVNG